METCLVTHHLAQINIGRFLRDKDDPANAGFMNALDHVNALAEATPGFIWRLTGEGNNATDVPVGDDPRMAVNLSVWRDLDALAGFAYRNPDHRAVMRRRREWFEPMEVFMTLWWVPAGHIPTVKEGLARLEILGRLGPTPDAFLFATPFAPPGEAAIQPVLEACD